MPAFGNRSSSFGQPAKPVAATASAAVPLNFKVEDVYKDLEGERPQYRLSTYGPGGNASVVDGKDLSPEELRMMMVQSGGNPQAYVRLPFPSPPVLAYLGCAVGLTSAPTFDSRRCSRSSRS